MRSGVQNKKKTTSEEKVTPSSGNVFADLGLPKANDALAKADLAINIGNIIRARKLSQKDAAELLGIDQPKVSALLRGKIDGFSTDRLLRFLVLLDQDVEIVIRPHKRAKGKAADVRVVCGSEVARPSSAGPRSPK